MPPRDNAPTAPVVEPLGGTPSTFNSVNTAPVATTGKNDLQREVERDEARATAFGTDPVAFQKQFERTRTVPTFTGQGKDKQQTGTKQVTSISKNSRGRIAKAKADFEARSGNNASAESISRGSGGGSFQTVGDFGGGGITIGGVKPLGG